MAYGIYHHDMNQMESHHFQRNQFQAVEQGFHQFHAVEQGFVILHQNLLKCSARNLTLIEASITQVEL